MSYDPIKFLVNELSNKLEIQGIGKKMLPNEHFESFELSPSNFREIKLTENYKKIAYVDGGNMELLGATNYSIQINRVYFSIFKGKERLKTKYLKPRIEFFSYVISTIKQSGPTKEVHYDINLFPHDKRDFELLPDPKDLSFSSTDRTVMMGTQRADISRMISMARRFSEWNFAKEIVKTELSEGDIIVVDGSLQTAFKNEEKYTNELYELGKEKGVTICGLSKTSKLFTESGSSLLGAIEQISKNVSFDRWYVPVAIPTSNDDRGMITAIKLHPNSEHIYRFEILRDQFKTMSQEEINNLLSTLAANSGDLALLGYPYGLIDADTYSRIKFTEMGFYQGIILSEVSRHPEWKRILSHGSTLKVHEDLNRVVG